MQHESRLRRSSSGCEYAMMSASPEPIAAACEELRANIELQLERTLKLDSMTMKADAYDHGAIMGILETSGQERFRTISDGSGREAKCKNVRLDRFFAEMNTTLTTDYELDGFTELERSKRKLEAVLKSSLAQAESESPWYNNMLASLKFDEFCEILTKFPDGDMLKISKQKRKDIFSGSLKILDICSVELKLNSSKDDPNNIWNENILQFICRNDIQDAADIILDGDLIYKIASESLLTNGLNSLGPDISKEVISYVKLFCCVMRLCLAGMSLDEEEDEEDAADFKRAVNDGLEDWEWLDVVLADNVDDHDYIDYSTQKLVSDLQIFHRPQLSINFV